MRVYLLPFAEIEDMLPKHLTEGIRMHALQEHATATAAIERAKAACAYAHTLVECNTATASQVSAARVAMDKATASLNAKTKALLSLEAYQQRRLCSLVGREMLDYNLDYLIEENAPIPTDDTPWLSLAHDLLSPTDQTQLAKRSECVLRFVLSAERCARLGVTRRHIQQCIHDYLQGRGVTR
jgi:hypothetical protein